MKTVIWYTRSGQRIAKRIVKAAKWNCIQGYRTGHIGTYLTCVIQPHLADRIEEMTLIEFVNWSGSFTYRPVRKFS